MAYKELATKKPFIVNKNLGSAVFTVRMAWDDSFLTTATGYSVSLAMSTTITLSRAKATVHTPVLYGNSTR